MLLLLSERRAVIALSSVYACRLLGLFILLPVIALYVDRFPGLTASNIGLLAGIYGLTQAIFQIPFGWLSDKYGRKPLIILGLVLFLTGSFLAAEAEDLTMLLWGRALQGSGAVGSVVLALLADLTRDSVRPKVMAMIGASIGASFMIAMVLSPWIDAKFGISTLFYVTGGCTFLALLITLLWVPGEKKTATELSPPSWGPLLSDLALWRLNSGVFCVHASLTALFLWLPGHLLTVSAWPEKRLWKVYLLVLFLSFLASWPFLSRKRLGHSHSWQRVLFVFWAGLAILFLAGQQGLAVTMTGMFVFFGALNWLEAALPAQISTVVLPNQRGTAMGIYSSLQFLGMFTGGLCGGALLDSGGPAALFKGITVLLIIWLCILTMTTHKGGHYGIKRH